MKLIFNTKTTNLGLGFYRENNFVKYPFKFLCKMAATHCNHV